jgi:hypothetical protein
MAETMLKIIRVFIASPGGLENERVAAKRIMDEINQSHAENWGCQFKLVGWEATLPGNSRAQSLINQDLDKCEYFVGLLWNHWGSKPDDRDSKFTSGFEEEFERAKARAEKSLADSVIALLSTINISNAFEMLVEVDPDTISERCVRTLFAYPDSISTSTAESCLELKSESVRRAAAALLHSRQALNVTTAEKLLSDTDIEVRFIAVESLIQQGVPLQEETVKKALVRQKPVGLLAFTHNNSISKDDDLYEKYQKNRLYKLSYEALKIKVETCNIFDRLELIVLSEKYGQKYLPILRANLSDGFKNYFNNKIAPLKPLYQNDGDLIHKINNLENHLRRELLSNTLDALCTHSNTSDLDLVRKTLDTWEVDFSENILKFLGRFGDWSDINRILALSNRPADHLSLLSIVPGKYEKPVASALYALGKPRLIDLLQLELSFGVRRALLKQFTQKDVSSLSDETLIAEFNRADDQFRKVLALKCALSLKRVRVRNLLDKYITQQGQCYYNSIHWLDFGAVMPQEIVKTVAKFELARST